MKPEERVRVGNRAKDTAQFVREMGDESASTKEGLEHFFRRLAEELGDVLPKFMEQPVEPMTDLQSKQFEFETIGFGQYKGGMFGKLPLEYLIWLEDEQRQMSRKLASYLRSQRVLHQRRMVDDQIEREE